MLFYLFFNNLFYFLQYLLLGAYTGAISSIIGIVRTVLFQNKSNNKILYLILFAYFTFGIITYQGIYSILPTIASLIYSAILWQDRPKNIRIGSAATLVMWVIYDISVNAYVGALTEVILCLSSVLALIKIDLRRQNYEN